ncbi:MAG TPA: haloacid dehalogenase [Dehalococcoidia bacterium]|jgi:HAD superfamily hydrolase (TIGR01450 family)|nr:haloacid dehalogenase [Dehalococcoidia bacterium]|tara:strand:+ start:201 stop:1037 length:837 start_codon:yes stop_codon:yes gene_type:complete
MTPIKDTTMQELIARYPVILFDSFGVLASSNAVLPGAVELIANLNAIAKTYFVLTNDASALPESRSENYAKLALNIKPEQIITSGGLLSRYFADEHLQGLRCVILGPEDSVRYVQIAGGEVVPIGADFDAVVIGDQSGFPFLETMDQVMTDLFRKTDKGENVRLILPNPDLIYPDGDGFGFASASIAMLLESALKLRYPERDDLHFIRLGKPHEAIFAEALRRSGTRDMVMIGDQLETDIKGANDFGLDSVLVGTGIAALDLSWAPESMRPTYTLRSL